MYTYERLGVPTVINASGMMTHLGGAALTIDVARAMAEAGQAHVDLMLLKRRAGEVIAAWAGAEAGWVTSGAAAGIAIMTAACVAGVNPARVARLPNADWEPRSILLQAGHAAEFGAPVEQMIRIGGGRPVQVGSVNACGADLLRAFLDERTAAVLFVQSHHAVQKGMLSLSEVIALAHEGRVPVLVDAAAEEDLQRYVAMGADLVTYSGGKAFGGPTSGIIVGRTDLIEACRAQERGIARPMKVGKEAIMGLLAALEGYAQRDKAARQAGQAICQALLDGLRDLPHTKVWIEADEAGRAITRVALSPDPQALGFDAVTLARDLQQGSPQICVRSHQARTGKIMLDPRPLRATDVDHITQAIRGIYARRGRS
jgi:uncharacterized pyridoxal phosphate-dependent enzyme